MAITITKKGSPPEKREWVGTCRNCGAEATALGKDVAHLAQYDQRENSRFAWMKCPCCDAGGSTGYGGILFYPKANTDA